MNKDYTDYEIDRELTGKWAIESNAELQEKYDELRQEYRRLEKEHNKLQVEHSRLLFDMDAVIEHEVEVKCKKLKEELEWYKTEHERLVDKLVIEGATELLDRKFENKKGWQGE